MNGSAVSSIEDAFEAPATPLFATVLLKALPSENDDGPWKFAGIASDESEDVEGDTILRKAIDLTYAKQRGYVNWDHSRQPADTLGFLTRADIILPSKVNELQKAFPDISEKASVYVEGELYKHMPKAADVYALLKSAPQSGPGGLGLSLDGSIARDTRNGGIVKAFVRGVAFTAQPVQPRTLVRLRKSIAAYNELNETGGLPADLPAAIAGEVVEQLTQLQKSVTQPNPLNHDQAVLYVLKQRPRWSYDLASRLVTYTMNKSNGS